MRRRTVATAFSVLALGIALNYCASIATAADAPTGIAAAKQQTVAVLQQWNGRVPAPSEGAPAVITDRAALEKLWRDWQIKALLPEVDFTRELVLTHVARSSLTRFMGFTLDEKGDLIPQIVATPDMPGYSSYAVCLIRRTGIRTVRGQPLK